MIPKGNQRGGGQNLATHLMNSFTNERVEIADLRGAVAQDLHGAFAEWFAESKATKCKEYLYSLSINPDNRQGDLTRDQYMDFIARTEKKLGLVAQPRAIVFHVKEGREHCHVVWSRIDSEKMRAVQLSNDRQKLRSVAQDFARDHGITLPAGMQKNRGLERFNEHAKGVSLAEKQQEERTGETKQERMAAITQAWRQSDNGRAFVQALEARGYLIARGDSKAYVVIDRYGEIHSLARQIEGAKTKDLKARLIDYPLEKLPAVEAAQDFVRRQREEAARARAERAKEAPARTPPEPEKPRVLTAAERRQNLEQKQKSRRDDLDRQRRDLVSRHTTEREALRDMQNAQNTGLISDRLKRQPKGLAAFLTRITGIQFLIDRQQRRQDRDRAGQHRQQAEALQRKHAREREDIDRRFIALSQVERREARSLETAQRREQFRAAARPAREQAQRETGKAPVLTKEQRQRVENFQRAGREMTEPQGAAGTPKGQEKQKSRGKGRLSEIFNRLADRVAHHETSSGGGSRQKEPPTAEKSPRLQEREQNAADITTPAAPEEREQDRGGIVPGGVADAFNKARAALEKSAPETERDKGPKPSRDPGRDRER